MKIFVQRNGVNYTATVPDDAVCLDRGHRGNLNEQPPIVEVDFTNRVYRRDGLNALPFPEKWYRTESTAGTGEIVVDWHELNEPVVVQHQPVVVGLKEPERYVMQPPADPLLEEHATTARTSPLPWGEPLDKLVDAPTTPTRRVVLPTKPKP